MASILVIDDDDQVRALVRAFLESAGFNVRVARDGSEGLDAYAREPADLILCDLFMPVREGLETIREVRRRWPGARVVAMSGGHPAYGPIDVLGIAARLGAAATLAKPFSRAELLRTVALVLPGGDSGTAPAPA